LSRSLVSSRSPIVLQLFSCCWTWTTSDMCNIKVNIAIAILGISAGVMAGLCFAIQYQNWSATIMAFISGLAATILLHLHLAYLKGWMIDWPQARFTCLIWAVPHPSHLILAHNGTNLSFLYG
uniref:DUF4203 domain-containing protein n=1 Tax=Heligmosomoides polygyrus TaxID=6339 RepID=A0A183GST7_HELPZ